LILYIG